VTEPHLLTERDAAKRLGVSRWWLAEQRKNHLIPHSSPSQRRVRYSHADLEAITRKLHTPASRGR
jgi:hypothetical protein